MGRLVSFFPLFAPTERDVLPQNVFVKRFAQTKWLVKIYMIDVMIGSRIGDTQRLQRRRDN